jgi:hypothetical protein
MKSIIGREVRGSAAIEKEYATVSMKYLLSLGDPLNLHAQPFEGEARHSNKG